MTVADLIEHLQQYPAHRTVRVRPHKRVDRDIHTVRETQAPNDREPEPYVILEETR